MIPDWQGVETRMGKWTRNGLKAWTQRVREFMSGKKVAQDAKGKRVGRLPSLAAKRQANYHTLMGLDQALRATLGWGVGDLRAARPCQSLKDGEIRQFVAIESLPEPLAKAAKGRKFRSVIVARDSGTRLEVVWSEPRRVLHLNMDCGPIGWPMAGYVFLGLQARGWRWADPAHRHSNNSKEAISEAGLGNIQCEGLVLTNCHAGPWGGAANHGRFIEWLSQFALSSSVDDPLFVAYYPFISHDVYHGRLPSEFGERKHMELMFDHLKGLTLQGQGTVVRLNRWFQLWQRLRPYFAEWSCYALAAMGQCLTRGYYSSAEECELFRGAEAAAEAPEIVQGGAPHGGGAGARAVRPHQDDPQQLRHRCQNTVHLACEILSSRRSRALLMGMSLVIQPLETRHNVDIKMMKTSGGREELNRMRSSGSDYGYLHEMAGVFFDMNVLWDMGLSTFDRRSDHTTLGTQAGTKVLKSLIRLFCTLAGVEVALSLHFSSCMPGLAFSQLSYSEEVRASGMHRMRDLFERLAAAEELALEAVAVQSLFVRPGFPPFGILGSLVQQAAPHFLRTFVSMDAGGGIAK